MAGRAEGDRVRPRAQGGGALRGRALPRQPDGARRAPRREPARCHLAPPRGSGARRPQRPWLRGTRRRKSRRGGLPRPSHPHRRARRRRRPRGGGDPGASRNDPSAPAVSRWARPARPWAPMAAGVLIIGLWWLVAHNAGSGWVQVLGDLVFGALLIGIVGPFVVATRARVTMRSAPGDGSAGFPVEVRVESRSRVRARPVDPPGPEAFVGPAGRRGAVDSVITLVPVRRGVHDAVTLDIASAAPFGLQWWTKRVQLPLPSALHVSPRCGGAQLVPRRPDEGTGDVLDRPRSEVGLPRGARPYVPGDARRLVHWR